MNNSIILDDLPKKKLFLELKDTVKGLLPKKRKNNKEILVS